ncbi:MAG: hypothetical protein WA393_05850 [Nitrososphaeraceae archaeon]
MSARSLEEKLFVQSIVVREMHDSSSGFASVNGLKMYYEIHGKRLPLVLIHGGGSTIQTSFGRVFHSDCYLISLCCDWLLKKAHSHFKSLTILITRTAL